MNIKYILSHPIHYQTALIKFLTKKGIKIEVLFRSNMHTKKTFDPGFNRKVSIAKNVLNGIKYKYLNYLGPNKVGSILPITTDFKSRIFEKETDIIWLHGIKNWYNLCLITIAKIYKKKVFIRDEVYHKSKNRSFLNKLFNYLFYLIVDNFIDIYLAIGSQNKKYYLDHNIHKSKIVMLPYVVDNNFFLNKNKNKNKKKNKKIKFLFVGKLIKRKGVNLLLEAIKILKYNYRLNNNCNFLIVGDGLMRNQLKKFVKDNELKNIKFYPFKNQNELKKIYRSADVFIMSSTREPWGLTVNEAMAAGNAVISSDNVGSSYDLIKNRKNGFIFKNGNAQDLANKIVKIVKNKKKLEKFKLESINIISKWDFNACYFGLKKSIKCVQKIN